MIGVWSVLQWQQLGSPPKLNLVELGPGRGTLMADLLRGIKTLKPFSSALSVHLVEVILLKPIHAGFEVWIFSGKLLTTRSKR